MTLSTEKPGGRFGFVFLVYLATLVVLWGWMILVRMIYPGDFSPDPVFRPYMGVEPVKSPLLDVWQRWDVLHYQAIAERGYAAFDTAAWTPPLHPWLMKEAGKLFFGNTVLGGLIVSNVFCLAALWAFHLLAEQLLPDKSSARRALVYLAIFPTSFFFFAPYSESLFFLAAVMSLYNATRKQWIAAGLWGGLAALSRLPGPLIVVPLLWTAWQEWKSTRDWRVLAAPGLATVCGLLFPLYTWLGLNLSVFAPFEAASTRFHGGFTFPGISLLLAAKQILLGIHVFPNLMDLLFTIIFIFGTILVWRRLPRVYGVYCLAFMALYLTRYADVYPLLSMTRYVLALFPVFICLPLIDQRPWARRSIIYPSILGLLYFSAQFAIWGWVG